MYPIPPGEHLVENRSCKKCATVFPITDKDMEFYTKVSPTFGEKKYIIPPPTHCPDCRQQRRLTFRNERKLYKRKCDATGKEIVSIYSPDKPFTVYHQDYWWSDAWNPMSYGREFDFGRGAMEQMGELMKEVPKPSLLNINIENSEFVNYSSNLKDCYLAFDVSSLESCFYVNNCDLVKNSVDISEMRVNSSNCYECLDCNNCNKIAYGWGCNDSYDSRYVVDLENAHHCFLSHTLYNKSYYFENVHYSPEEYEKKVINFYNLSSRIREEKIKKWRYSYQNEKIYPYHLSVSFENSYGSGLKDVRNAICCYSIHESEDVKYCTHAEHLKDCHDVSSVGGGGECCYELNAAMQPSFVVFGFGSWGNKLYYSDHVSWSNNCFLCTGLRNKSYCILNHQYTKEKYESLVPRIIKKMIEDGEWGEFFPASMSPFGYNETVAQEYFPLTREEATKYEVFNWSDYEAPFPKVEKIIQASKLPDTIENIPDDILNWAIECEVIGKPFRIIKQELEFYRKHNLPIPRRHPDVRHRDRMQMRNPRNLFERTCDCEACEYNWKVKGIILDDTNSLWKDPETSSGGRRKKLITTYSPERPEIVYCEECYEREVMN